MKVQQEAKSKVVALLGNANVKISEIAPPKATSESSSPE